MRAIKLITRLTINREGKLLNFQFYILSGRFHCNQEKMEAGSSHQEQNQESNQVYPTRPKLFCCHICDETFHSRNRLKKHVEKLHPKRYCCHICDEPFHTQSSLKKHIEDLHPKRYSCHICDEDFHSRGYLKDHIEVFH